MLLCENCSLEHDGKYGSGRFCCCKCSRAFSTKNKRKEINEKVSKTKSNKVPCITKICPICNGEFKVKPSRSHKIFCSKKCARKNFSNLGHKALKENPPNWSNVNKKSYSNGHNYIAGGTTNWLDYKDIKVQGNYELRTCKILDKIQELGLIKCWEYIKDRISYIGIDEKEHSYLLDFKVINNDGSFYYIEVKGYEKENDKYKWEAAKNAGHKLEIWFESEIKQKEIDLNS